MTVFEPTMATEAPAVEATVTEAPALASAETGGKQSHKLDRKWTFWFDNQSKPKQGAAWGSSLRELYTFDTVEEFWRGERGAILELISSALLYHLNINLGVLHASVAYSLLYIVRFINGINCEVHTSFLLRRTNRVKHHSFLAHYSVESLYDQLFKPSKLPLSADFHLFKTGIEPKWEDPECASGGKWTVTVNRKEDLENMWLETLMTLIGEQFDESEVICGVVASVRQKLDKLSLWTKTATNEAAQMSIGRKWKEIIDVDKISYSFHEDAKKDRSTKSRYNV